MNTILYIILTTLILGIVLITYLEKNKNIAANNYTSFLKAILFGGVAAILSLKLEEFIVWILPDINSFFRIIFFAIMEELLLFLIVYKFIFTKRNVQKMKFIILYIILAGLGFAIVENILRIINFINIKPILDLTNVVVSTTLARIIFSAFLGFTYGLLRFKVEISKQKAIILSIFMGAITHSSFNFLASSGNQLYKNISFYSIWSFLVIFVIVFILIKDINCKR